MCFAASSVVDGGARIGASHGESAEQTRSNVGEPHGTHFLIGVDTVVIAGSKVPRSQHAANQDNALFFHAESVGRPPRKQARLEQPAHAAQGN